MFVGEVVFEFFLFFLFILQSQLLIQITDFGLSKVFESDADAVMKTTYVGTRGYQAPELLLDKPYDLTSDIFSAGVVLFILLTGCMCFIFCFFTLFSEHCWK